VSPVPLVSYPFRFSIVLPAPPDAAYRWATDYRPDDLALMGEEGTRRVDRLASDVVLLTDTVRTGRSRVTKTRLVRLLPERRAWTNTHLAGPLRHSQFLYELLPAGRGRSRLTFTGLQVEAARRPIGRAARAARAREIARRDRATWHRLARAMARELRARGRA
jgi:hypothetical protein